MKNSEEIYRSPTGKVFVSEDLIKVIKSFPTSKEINHCNSTFPVSPFDFYGICPKCNAEIKLRSSSANYELEDVFDAVFEWLIRQESQKLFEKRLLEIKEDL